MVNSSDLSINPSGKLTGQDNPTKMATKAKKKSTRKAPFQARFFAVAPAPAQAPTPNEVLNFTINALAFCSGFSASSINNDWVLGDSMTDGSGDKHPGAGLDQDGIDICFITKLNQFVEHFGSSNTIAAGTYTGTSKVSDVASDVGQRV